MVVVPTYLGEVGIVDVNSPTTAGVAGAGSYGFATNRSYVREGPTV